MTDQHDRPASTLAERINALPDGEVRYIELPNEYEFETIADGTIKVSDLKALASELAAEREARERAEAALRDAIDHLGCMCGEVGVCSECALRVRLQEAAA